MTKNTHPLLHFAVSRVCAIMIMTMRFYI